MPVWSMASRAKFPREKSVEYRKKHGLCNRYKHIASTVVITTDLGLGDSSRLRQCEIDIVKCSMNMIYCILCNVMKITLFQLPDYRTGAYANHSSNSEGTWDSCNMFHSRCLQSSWPKFDRRFCTVSQLCPVSMIFFTLIHGFSLFTWMSCDLCHSHCFICGCILYMHICLFTQSHCPKLCDD